MNVANKTVVITGASRGLGAALAQEFHQRQMNLVLCARSAPVLPPGERVVAEQLDVTDEAAVQGLAIAAEERFGAIDAWINNAGVLEPVDMLRRVSSEAFRRCMDINVVGVFNGTKAYLAHLRRRGTKGVLLNVSSGAARRGFAGWSAYCASKAAVDRMTEAVQLEEEEVVRAHAVAPGVIDTDMQALIRQMPADRFPTVEQFRQLKAENSFSSTAFVAKKLLELAFDPAAETTEVLVDFPPGR